MVDSIAAMFIPNESWDMTDPSDPPDSSTYEMLAASVRRLIDATIRTEVPPEVVASAAAKIDSVTSELSAALMPGSFGERTVDDGQPVAAGNAVIGIRNPSAPPLVIHHNEDGSVWTEFTLGAAYEGPPGHVHGGVIALILDHVLGAPTHKPGRPAYTGTLTMRYHRATRLRRPLRSEARIESVDGLKKFVVGHISDADGPTVTAEGVFIHRRDSKTS